MRKIFKSKKLYIIILILFTLILCADCVVAITVHNTPSMPGGNMQGFGGGDMPSMPDGTGTAPEVSSSATPQGQSGSGEATGTGDASAADGTGAESSDSTGAAPQGDFTPPDMGTSGKGGSQSGGFLRSVRKAFLPILIVCVLVDAFCVFMLLKLGGALGRKSVGEDIPAAPLSEEEKAALAKKKSKRMWISILALVLVVTVLLAVLPSIKSSTGGTITAVESVLSAEAAQGDIESVFWGSGTLSDDSAVDVSLVDGVELLGYTVKNGTAVKTGDTIAKVDRSSVMEAVSTLQTAMDTLDAKIESASADTISASVTAGAGGRVKAVYAVVGESVLDAMYDHGALLRISLDGLMAVDVPDVSGVSQGESVTVTLSDGTKVEGRVAQISKDTATVTIDDDEGDYDESVAVSLESGKSLGSGKLYIHSELKVTGFSGTVAAVYVSEDDEVCSGQTMIYLYDTEYKGEYESLIAKREEYSKELQRLVSMYRSGCVTAECDGIVSGISDGADYVALASTGSSGGVKLLSCFGNEKGTIVLLSSGGAGKETTPVETTPVETTPVEPTPAVTTPVETTPVEPTPVYTKYVGKVSAVAYGQLSMLINPSPVSMDASALSSADSSLFTTPAQYAPGAGVSVTVYSDAGAVAGSLSDIKAGDTVLLTFTDDVLTGIDCVHSASSQTPAGGDAQTPSGGQSGGTASGSSSGTTATVETEYTLNLTAICSIVPDNVMTVLISADELDVLSLAVGQEAMVTLDALSGQSFSGVVTGIDPVGVNSGGSTKYSVTLTMDRTELMLNGMNASARITVGTVEDVLMIPEAAIYEDGIRSLVYTSYNKKTDELTDPVEVTTGVSDGDNVQILSGLSVGDTYYYKYADSIVFSA